MPPLPVMQVGFDYVLLLLFLSIPFIVSYLVFSGAVDRRNPHPWAWAGSVYVLLLLGILPGIIVISLYLVVR